MSLKNTELELGDLVKVIVHGQTFVGEVVIVRKFLNAYAEENWNKTLLKIVEGAPHKVFHTQAITSPLFRITHDIVSRESADPRKELYTEESSLQEEDLFSLAIWISNDFTYLEKISENILLLSKTIDSINEELRS